VLYGTNFVVHGIGGDLGSVRPSDYSAVDTRPCEKGYDVVARRPEQLGSPFSDVFVELEVHATGSEGTAMMRSRAASAP